ncbi:MAG: TetR/AcrR family transcriptional regulator [Methanobacteriaceae archaeon]|jgi:AcrR family transcriptional regulator|nr:TetR/AcrR family transcriptional regulator [Methanobacteriaceae archaeon]OPY23399.1 MAG: DNA-binding transcriptional repressor AcrR [Methanobacterium sp. PtaU1.Bin097]
MTTRMERKKEEKKEAILDAAEAIIAEKGFRYMTMDQVANAADVAKGTLYLYFKNKISLCAAVDAWINKELNHLIEGKMDKYNTGSEKIVAAGTATVEFSLKDPQKWKAATELYQIKFKDTEDPNVQEFLHEVNQMIQMLADAYRQGISEGTIWEELDPLPTSIYVRMALTNAFTPTHEQKMLLELNDISQEHYLAVAWNLLNRSTHVKSSIREESEKSLEEQRSPKEIKKEIKEMADSLGLNAGNALEILDSWKILSQIIMGKFEYNTIEATEEKFMVHVRGCPVFNPYEKGNSFNINMIEGCQRYSRILVETLNPKYTARINERMCKGDDYCEVIVELKNPD